MIGFSGNLYIALDDQKQIAFHVFDTIANGQAVGGDGRASTRPIDVKRRLLKFVNRVDPACGIPGMELSDEYCSHLIYNL